MLSRSGTYLYPLLGGVDALLFRVAGPGLGNSLLPWARAVAVARRHALPVIAPTWPQLKLGPLLRGELDRRMYYNMFEAGGYVRGVRRLRLLSTKRRIDEQEFADNHEVDDVVVTFAGMQEYFAPIANDREIIWDELVRITRRPHRDALAYDFRRSISVHVRFGDQGMEARTPVYRERIAIEWYVAVVEALRARCGPELPVHVFSDGKPDELAPLLRLPNVQLRTFGSAVADLLALVRADVLVASGSTFSMWASYLGRMPVVWYPRQLRQQLYQGGLEVEATAQGTVPISFLDGLDEIAGRDRSPGTAGASTTQRLCPDPAGEPT